MLRSTVLLVAVLLGCVALIAAQRTGNSINTRGKYINIISRHQHQRTAQTDAHAHKALCVLPMAGDSNRKLNRYHKYFAKCVWLANAIRVVHSMRSRRTSIADAMAVCIFISN